MQVILVNVPLEVVLRLVSNDLTWDKSSFATLKDMPRVTNQERILKGLLSLDLLEQMRCRLRNPRTAWSCRYAKLKIG